MNHTLEKNRINDKEIIFNNDTNLSIPENLKESLCKQNKNKKNGEDFIKKAIEIHGNAYDYCKVDYEGRKKKVTLICKHANHGEFTKTPYDHIDNKKGCPICGRKNRKITPVKTKSTVEKFVIEAKKIHGETYDYSKVIFNGYYKKVIIVCKIHGDYLQLPHNHIVGAGCSKCGAISRGDKRRFTRDDFIIKAQLVHGDKYDYTKVNYVNIDTKISIQCKIHGTFEQTPYSHINGTGCSKCVGLCRRTTEEFIEKAKKVHNSDHYDYSEVNYVNSFTHVKIKCPNHGDFKQTPSCHLNGQKCPKCRQTTFSGMQVKWLDFIKNELNIDIVHALNEGEYKIEGSKYKADGYCEELRTIFEFHGCFWHGCEKCYPNRNEKNRVNYKSYNELYENTIKKEKLCLSKKYKYIQIWECEWNEIKKTDDTLKKYSCELHEKILDKKEINNNLCNHVDIVV
jgi:G:T-mismatch repair DNA endonuclease (very short patch repair protein)